MAQVKLNPETGTMEFSDGSSLPIPQKYKKELQPASREEGLQADEMAKIRSEIGNLGSLGEGAFQLGEGSSFLKGGKDVGNWLTSLADSFAAKEGQEDMSFWERQGELYAAKRKANEALSGQISEDSPISSTIGKGLGIGADLALTRGMSGAKALPLMSLAEKGTDVIRDPLGSAKDAAISGVAGYAGDKIIGGLSKAANRRMGMRDNAALESQIAESNVLGQQATNLANAQGKANNILASTQVAQQNANNLASYQTALDLRKQKILDMENFRNQLVHQRDTHIAQLKTQGAQRSAARDAEILRIQNDIKLIDQQEKAAQKAYNEELKKMPEMRRKAQQEHSENVLKNVSKLEKVIGKEDRIYGSQINTSQFVQDTIRSGEKAGTKEGKEVEKFVNSLFPENASFNRGDLINRYRAIEKRIEKSNSETADLLNQFKGYLGEKLVPAIQDAAIYRKISKPLSRDVEKSVLSIGKELNLSKESLDALKGNVGAYMSVIPRADFASGIGEGTLKNQLKQSIMNEKSFGMIVPEEIMDVTKRYQTLGGKATLTKDVLNTIEGANKVKRDQLNKALKAFDSQLDSILAKYHPDIQIIQADTKKKLGKTLSNSLGVAEDIAMPMPPQPMARPTIPPTIPPVQITPTPIAPIVPPAMPVRPTAIPEPLPFTPQSFTPQQAPVLPPASGMAEKLGERLENFKPANLLKTNGLLDNPLTKLASLKYVLGKAALPVEAAALGSVGLMKALTSPSTLGQVIRRTAKGGGLTGVYKGFDEYAKTKYSTYQNGIIGSPEQRFEAVAEIEKDPLLDLEEKAMLQMKINRGQQLK